MSLSGSYSVHEVGEGSGQSLDCGAAISASWLLPVSLDRTSPGPTATDDKRRTAAACGPVVREARVWVGSLVGFGALVVVVGGSAVSEHREVRARHEDRAPGRRT
jgi:hypothetical protein